MVERMQRKVGGGGNYFSSPKKNLKFISSGCKTLDLALGGGWAEGRIANIVGDSSTGKTLLCIEVAANFNAKYPKGRILYREAEAAFDIEYARALGMPVESVDFGDQLATVEDLFEDLTKQCKRSTPTLYILDSLDALSDRSEMERDIDQGSYGAAKAKKMSELFRRMVRSMSNSNLTLIIVSQVRDKIGVTFGRKFTRTGGRALDFYASQIVLLAKRGEIIKTVNKVTRSIGVKVRAKVDKNKIALAHRESDFSIRFGYGVDDLGACLQWLADVGRITEVGLTADEKVIKAYAAKVMASPNGQYETEVKKVYDLTEKAWYDIEKGFLPERKKYQTTKDL